MVHSTRWTASAFSAGESLHDHAPSRTAEPTPVAPSARSRQWNLGRNTEECCCRGQRCTAASSGTRCRMAVRVTRASAAVHRVHVGHTDSRPTIPPTSEAPQYSCQTLRSYRARLATSSHVRSLMQGYWDRLTRAPGRATGHRGTRSVAPLLPLAPVTRTLLLPVLVPSYRK